MGGLIIIIGTAFVIIGFLILFLSIVASFLSRERAEVRKGAVIMIGPIPIVLADDPRTAKLLMTFAIVLMILFLLFMLIVRP